MNEDLTIIIPAAGMGRRMKSYGPKSLIDLGNGQSVINRQISLLNRKFPKAKIVVVVGFEKEKIISALPPDVSFLVNPIYATTNVSYSINLALNYYQPKKVLLVYGDLVFNEATLDFALDKSFIIVDSKQQIRDSEVGVTVVNGEVSQMSYGLTTKWAHIAYLDGKELSIFIDNFTKQLQRYYGFEMLNIILNNGGSLQAIEPENMRIVEIDSSKDIKQAKDLINESYVIKQLC
jgi:choline kinase